MTDGVSFRQIGAARPAWIDCGWKTYFMDPGSDSWTIRHFSQANPAGPDIGNVPALLRRVADSIEDMGPVEVPDLVLHSEATVAGDWYSVTVYFHDKVH